MVNLGWSTRAAECCGRKLLPIVDGFPRGPAVHTPIQSGPANLKHVDVSRSGDRALYCAATSEAKTHAASLAASLVDNHARARSTRAQIQRSHVALGQYRVSQVITSDGAENAVPTCAVASAQHAPAQCQQRGLPPCCGFAAQRKRDQS